ncbi:hypothetical protein [Alienimonas sp. DA493]|uniref:hypothetical protein n=1 Tax=Alienimonas sp. DA493 TaxID=3373605 RepID=UPI003754F48D
MMGSTSPGEKRPAARPAAALALFGALGCGLSFVAGCGGHEDGTAIQTQTPEEQAAEDAFQTQTPAPRGPGE